MKNTNIDIKMNSENNENKCILFNFEDFIKASRMLDGACRQWCKFIDENPERRSGEFFTEFYEKICKQKYQEYLDDSAY